MEVRDGRGKCRCIHPPTPTPVRPVGHGGGSLCCCCLCGSSWGLVTSFPLGPQHSMIYFFHHYELPAILQQIRIQEMLLQNQQVGQGTQTTLQDNLNNNTTAAPIDMGTRRPHLPTGPSAESSSPISLAPGEGPGAGAAATSSAIASDLNWVAETAAIITEASFLSDLSLLEPNMVHEAMANRSPQDAAAAASSLLARIRVSSDRPEAAGGSITIEVTSTPVTAPAVPAAAEDAPAPPLAAAPPTPVQEDGAPVPSPALPEQTEAEEGSLSQAEQSGKDCVASSTWAEASGASVPGTKPLQHLDPSSGDPGETSPCPAAAGGTACSDPDRGSLS